MLLLDNLPKDIKYSIAIHLSLPDLHSLIRCNKKLSRIASDDGFWQRKLYHDSGKISQVKHTTYKKYYMKYAFPNKLYVQDRNTMLASGVEKIVQSKNHIFYIDIYHTLWHYTSIDNPEKSALVGLGFLSYKEDGVQVRLCSDVKDVCIIGNDLLLDIYNNLYIYKSIDERILLSINVKSIGSTGQVAYYIKEDGDLHFIEDEDDIFVAKDVEKAVIDPKEDVFYVTKTGELWKWGLLSNVLVSLNSSQINYNLEHKRLIASGVKDVAWGGKLLLLDDDDYLHIYNENELENVQDICRYIKVAKLCNGDQASFIDNCKNYWQKGGYDFMAMSNIVDICCLNFDKPLYIKYNP